MNAVTQPPAPERIDPPPLRKGGNGHGRHPDEPGPGSESSGVPPRRRGSVWPFLLDLGLVMILFDLIISGRWTQNLLMVVGAVVFLVALTGWIREAREEFSRLAD